MYRYESFADRHLNVVSRSGPEFLVRCVFHEDGTKASMYVNVERGLFYCHGCQAKGTMKRLAKLFDSGLISSAMSLDSIRERLRTVGIVEREETRRYTDSWLKQFAVQHPYWEDSRGLSPDVIDLFDLGYDPFTDAAIIPLRDSYGHVIGVIRRHMGDYTPRYLYPKGFKMSRFLFAAWLVRKNGDKTVAITEGSVDCIAMWDAGIPAVAALGSRLSDFQAHLLKSLGVRRAVLLSDNDRAGLEAVLQWHEALEGVQCYVPEYPHRKGVKDPADMRLKERRDAFNTAVPWHRAVVSAG